MTNCLFAQGIEAVTGELVVRFLRPVETDHVAEVSACLTRVSHRLYILEAELIQEQVPVARAQGKFVKRPAVVGTRPG
jgi:acyl-CoA thioesterase FadM